MLERTSYIYSCFYFQIPFPESMSKMLEDYLEEPDASVIAELVKKSRTG